jgi:hypothetical protein
LRLEKLAIIVLPIGGVDKSGKVILAKMPGWFGKKGHPFPGNLGYTPATGRCGRIKQNRTIQWGWSHHNKGTGNKTMHFKTVLAGLPLNHNETLVRDRTAQPQADAGMPLNHNETLVRDRAAQPQVKAVQVPGIVIVGNHNETLLRDRTA